MKPVKAGWLSSGDHVYVYTARDNYPEVHAESFDTSFRTIKDLKEAAAAAGDEDIVIFKLKLSLVREHLTSEFRLLGPEPMIEHQEAIAPPPVPPEIPSLPTGAKPPCTR